MGRDGKGNSINSYGWRGRGWNSKDQTGKERKMRTEEKTHGRTKLRVI